MGKLFENNFVVGVSVGTFSHNTNIKNILNVINPVSNKKKRKIMCIGVGCV